jgi:prophage DNA circulation protein
MSQISDFHNPWRDMLIQQASFRGIIFHVETGTKMGGRRTVVHEYPKRNDPYSEDMGMQAQRFSFQGYLIYRPDNAVYNYVRQRVALYSALEQDGPGLLKHPVFCPRGLDVMCERFSMIENRTRGGFTEFEMQFVDLGTAGNSQQVVNTVMQVTSQANATDAATTSNANSLGTPAAQLAAGIAPV